MFRHLDYDIDKNKYRDLFYNSIQKYGQWHWSNVRDQRLWWYQLFIKDDHPLKKEMLPVEEDLNILGMNNYPRFRYQFPNTTLPHHLDEDEMVSININLLDTTPVIHLNHEPYPYEAALVDVGHVMHGVESDPNERLILKFCLRHPLSEVEDRLNDVGLIINYCN